MHPVAFLSFASSFLEYLSGNPTAHGKYNTGKLMQDKHSTTSVQTSIHASTISLTQHEFIGLIPCHIFPAIHPSVANSNFR
jgi:hypothetical protein